MARSLFPREHGAYAQLAAPLLAALLGGSPSRAGGSFAVAAIAAFLANEPLLVLLGHRGPRMKQQARSRAWRWLLVLLATLAVAGTLGLALARGDARIAAVIPIAPATILVALAVSRGQHSLAGEGLAAIALPSAAVPIAVAAGAPIGTALATWLAWAAGYAASVIAIHRVIDRRRGSPLLAGCLVVLSLVAVIACHTLRPALPLVAVSAALVLRPPAPRRLRAIGFVLVGASIVSIVIAVLG